MSPALEQYRYRSRVSARGGRTRETVCCTRQPSDGRSFGGRPLRLANARVFGSTARGTDTSGSDLDLLVDPLAGATLFDLGGFQDEMEELLGVAVDVRTLADLPEPIRGRVLGEAKPI